MRVLYPRSATSDQSSPDHPLILYVTTRLPLISMTFVYRELFGLRARGFAVRPVSIYRPDPFAEDAVLGPLAAEAVIIYSAATLVALPCALVAYAPLFARACIDALRADHGSVRARAKHVVQAIAALGSAWRLRRAGVTHVHAHMADTPAMVALYLARALGAKFSFTGHAADLFVHRSALAFKLRGADFVSCISHWHRDFYRAIEPASSDRLRLVRCSVELPATFTPGAPGNIVTVARLVAKKGVDLLLRALATIDGDWRLRIIGDGAERAALAALSDTLGIADRIKFEGAQPHANALAAIRQAAIFVLPCRTAASGDKDGIPVVLMEAMAARRAVIAGDLPAIRELVEDGRSGLLVPPDDVAALAQAIRRLLDAPESCAAIGAEARAAVAREFSDEVNIDRLTDALFDAGQIPATASAGRFAPL